MQPGLLASCIMWHTHPPFPVFTFKLIDYPSINCTPFIQIIGARNTLNWSSPGKKYFWLYVGYTLSLFWRKNLCLAKNFILKVWPAGYNIIWKYLCVVFCARSTNTSCPNKEWAIPITCHVCGSDLISISGLSIVWPSFRTRFVSKRFSAAF